MKLLRELDQLFILVVVFALPTLGLLALGLLLEILYDLGYF